MGFKITGTTVLWAIALVCGFLMGRQWLREQLIGMLEDTTKYAVFPESEPISGMDFDKPLEFTVTEPIFPEGVLYNPEQ